MSGVEQETTLIQVVVSSGFSRDDQFERGKWQSGHCDTESTRKKVKAAAAFPDVLGIICNVRQRQISQPGYQRRLRCRRKELPLSGSIVRPDR